MKLFINYIKQIVKVLDISFMLLILGLFANNTTWIPYALFSIVMTFYDIKSKLFNKTTVALMIFSLSYLFAMAYNHDSMVSSVGFLICLILAPSASYNFGYSSVRKLNYNKDFIILLILIIIISFTLIVYVKTIHSITITGEIVNVSRILFSDTSDDVSKTATLYGLISAVGLAGLPVYCFFKDFRSRFYNVFFVLVALLSLLVAIHLLNRTALVILMIAFFMVVLLKSNFNMVKILFYAILLLISMYFIMDFVNIDIIDAFIARNEESDFAGGGGRFWRWGDAILKMWKYPFGWIFNSQTYNDYCHNMWLDFARQAGWIPFLTFSILTFKSFKTVYKIIIIERTSFTSLLVVMNVCLFLACSMEPVMEGCAFILFFYCLVLGIQDAYFHKLKLLQKIHSY